MRSGLIALAATAAGSGVPAYAAAQELPSFTPLTGAVGCFSSEEATSAPLGSSMVPAPGCTQVRGLGHATGLALAPDERHLYVTSYPGALVTFARNTESGALSAVGCVSETGESGRLGTEGFCGDGDALAAPTDVAVSPDGRFVYVTARDSAGIAWLARDPASGALTPSGCAKEAPRSDHCRTAYGLAGASAVAIAPDGRHLYVASPSDGAIAVFARDAETGALTPAGCVSDSGSDGRCTNGTALAGVNDVIVAPDGQSVYAVSSMGAITGFARDPDSGALTPRACLLGDALPGGSCTDGPALGGASAIAITPDAAQLLVAAPADAALSVFRRDPLTAVACFRDQDPQGADSELPAPPKDEDDEPGRAADASSCRPARALRGVSGVAVSGDGRAVFTMGADQFSAFRRDPVTGALEQAACFEALPAYRSCGEGLVYSAGTGRVVASRDGRSVYLLDERGMSVLGATVAIASGTSYAARSGRTSIRLTCPAARARSCRGVVSAGSGVRRHYRLAPGHARAIALQLAVSTRRVLRRHGHATIRVLARNAGTRRVDRRVVVRARR